VRSFSSQQTKVQDLASLVTVKLQGYVSADESGPVATPFTNLVAPSKVIYKKVQVRTPVHAHSPRPMHMFLWMSSHGPWSRSLSQGIFGASPKHPTFLTSTRSRISGIPRHAEVTGYYKHLLAQFIANTTCDCQKL